MVARWTTAVLALCCLVGAWPITHAVADEDAADDSWDQQTSVSVEASREMWAGAEAFGRVWSLYAGSTYAPSGNLRQDGFRLRAVTAISRFKYNGLRYDPARGDAVNVDFRGQSRVSDLYAGYQLGLGATTVKVFAGWEMAVHVLTPFDPETLVQGNAMGPKAALEIWTNFTERIWGSLDLSYARAFGAYSARGRIGWRSGEMISLGPEISFIGHDESRMQRYGGFLRFDNGVDELSASAGWWQARGDDGGAYVGAQWLRRF